MKINWAHYLTRHFPKEDIQMAQEKILNITNHQRDADQSHTEIHLTSVRVGIIKKTTNRSCWQGYREKGTLMPIDGNVNYFTMENSMESPQKIKNRTMYDPEIPLLGLIQREQKHCFEKTYASLC